VLATCPNAASTRAVAVPPAVVLSVSDNLGSARTLAQHGPSALRAVTGVSDLKRRQAAHRGSERRVGVEGAVTRTPNVARLSRNSSCCERRCGLVGRVSAV
jgi:hypothetical protein